MEIKKYTRGSQVTLWHKFLIKGSLIDPLNPIIDIRYNGQPYRIIDQLTRIAVGYYYYNMESLDMDGGIYDIYFKGTIDGKDYSYMYRIEIVDNMVVYGIGPESKNIPNTNNILPSDPISRLRIELGDASIDPSKWVFSDIELQLFLSETLDDMNVAPPRTIYVWSGVPGLWIPNILLGSKARALLTMSIKIAASPISYNDKGVQISKLAQFNNYKSLYESIWAIYRAEKDRIKRTSNMPVSGWIVSAQSPYQIFPPLRASDRRFW